MESQMKMAFMPLGTSCWHVYSDCVSTSIPICIIRPYAGSRGPTKKRRLCPPAKSRHIDWYGHHPNNEPIAGAFVNVRLLGVTGIIIASTVTDSNGRYVITDLPPGSYTISATASGFETKAVGAIIETNATEIADIMLTGVFGSINGVVLNNLAQPIVGSSISLSRLRQ
ncbi:carboxypeptidase regulatory-like domain-containing protein [Bacillus megaterium]|nr:carboxypeptidase regulatory-like domain-containing protein [Priestia megaterium]